MTHNLPIIPWICLLFMGAPLAMAEDPAPDVGGDALVTAAIDSLVRQPPFEAKVRQRATLFGQLLAGAGLYVQARDADRLLIRFEFQVQIAEKTLSLLQVSDGSTLWIRRDMEPHQSQAYVDLRRLREAMTDPKTSNPSPTLGSPPLAIGGLPQLLRSVSEHFQFGSAKTTEISGIPMWELTGEWKKDKLKLLLPDQQKRIEAGQSPDVTQLPAQLPTTVKLILGRDRNFPLFPYRIEYSRLQPILTMAGTATGKSGGAQVRPLVTMEFYEVRRRTDLTPDMFKFSPGDQNVEDKTESYLRQLRSAGAN